MKYEKPSLLKDKRDDKKPIVPPVEIKSEFILDKPTITTGKKHYAGLGEVADDETVDVNK